MRRTPASRSASFRSSGAAGPTAATSGTSRAECDQVRIERQARAGVEDDADRRSRGKAGKADGEARIVDQRRADADHHRIGLDAHRLHRLERGAAADDHALALAPADHPVGGDGELEDDVRPVRG